MFTIVVDFIELMHCHGCRLGQVLFILKCTCWPTIFQVHDVSSEFERRMEGLLEDFACLGQL